MAAPAAPSLHPPPSPREAFRAAFLLALMLGGLFIDALAAGDRVLSFAGTDVRLYFAAWRRFGAETWLRESGPALWNPHLFAGQPFLGGFQPALLYPLNLHYLFLPLVRALNLEAILGFYLTAFFTWLWLRRRGASEMAALTGAALTTLGGAGFLRLFAGFTTAIAAGAWTPLALLAAEALALAPSGGWILAGAFALGMQILAGHPQTVYLTALAAALAFAARVEFRRPAFALRALAAFAAAQLLGAAMGAAQWMPAMAAAAESSRGLGGLPFKDAAYFSFATENLLTLLAPRILGDDLTPATPYWGRNYYWEMNIFFGAAAGALAMAGLLRGGKPARRDFAILLFFAVAALGWNTPVFAQLHAWLPGFKMFRAPARMMFFASFFAAALAARGLDALRNGPPPARWAEWVALTAAGAMVLLGLGMLLVGIGPDWDDNFQRLRSGIAERGEAFFAPEIGAGAAPPDGRGITEGGRALMGLGRALLTAALPAALAGGLLAGIRRRKVPAAALAALAFAELFSFARGNRPAFDRALIDPDPALVQFREQTGGRDRVLLTDGAVNAPMAAGLESIWGYDPQVNQRYLDFLKWALVQPPETLRKILGMLRCRHGLAPDPGGGYAVREIAVPLPQLFLVDRWRLAEGEEAERAAVADPAFNPAHEAILERAPRPAPQTGEGPPGEVRILGEASGSIDVEVRLERPALLLAADGFSRDWRAAIREPAGEAPIPVIRANAVLRAFPLPAGRRVLRIEYAPPLWRIGLALSAAAWLGFAAGTGVILARRRRAARNARLARSTAPSASGVPA